MLFAIKISYSKLKHGCLAWAGDCAASDIEQVSWSGTTVVHAEGPEALLQVDPPQAACAWRWSRGETRSQGREGEPAAPALLGSGWSGSRPWFRPPAEWSVGDALTQTGTPRAPQPPWTGFQDSHTARFQVAGGRNGALPTFHADSSNLPRGLTGKQPFKYF